MKCNIITILQCKKLENDPEFYKNIDHDPTQNIIDAIKSETQNMFDKNIIDKKEFSLITEHLDKPRMSIFYGLPKIHKIFNEFPPLRPIVSGFNSCTSRLSEYLDTFLKFQAKKCTSYVRYTKDFFPKINEIKSLPKNTILVTMDIASLYTNIDHLEGANACYDKLEKRKNKTIPSSLLRNLILLVLKSNVSALICNFTNK